MDNLLDIQLITARSFSVLGLLKTKTSLPIHRQQSQMMINVPQLSLPIKLSGKSTCFPHSAKAIYILKVVGVL